MDTVTRPPLCVINYLRQYIVGSSDVDGEVTVYFKLSRMLSEYECEVNNSLNLKSEGVHIDEEHGLRSVRIAAVQTDDLPRQVSILNEKLRLIEDMAATNEARAALTKVKAQNVLRDFDFDAAPSGSSRS